MYELVDIGVNLTNKAFRADLQAVVDRAHAAGVAQLVVTGTSATESAAALALAGAHPGRLFATAGVHPHVSRDWTDATADELRRLAAHPAVVAIGECGLDYDRDFSPRPAQREAFAAQLDLASELARPVFVHERAAAGDLLDILGPRRAALSAVVVHCFTGDERTLEAYLAMDLHIGITGWICDERRGTHLVDLLHRVPLDRLMIETDAPYLLPRTIRPRPRSRRNEPAHLPHVLEAVARAYQLPAAEVAERTTRTARAFFGLPASPGSS